MIRRLRLKFVCITMTIVTVMMTLMFCFQYRTTQVGLEQSSIKALQAAAQGPMGALRPGFGREGDQPCFILSLNAWGGLLVDGDKYYDLTDEAMNVAIYNAAYTDGQAYGVLEQYGLRYYRAETPVELRYVFTDIQLEQQTLRQLLRSSVAIGVAGFTGFLVISILLANWAVRPVERAWEEQRRFVADASHELKTPLTVILTNAEMLQEPGHEEAQRQQFSDSILTMSHQMRGLVENLLQLARADCGQTKPERAMLDWSRTLERGVLPFEPVYFEQGLLLESDIEPGVTLTGNEAQLSQVAEILLDNARKYSTPGGMVRLTLHTQGRQAVLSVASSGAVLTAQQCRDIFRRFYRVDEARSRDGSYGLGLSIAERIVSDHRGKIWAEGKDGVNTFFVSLPLV